MRAPTTLAATTLVTAAALLLTACGGGKSAGSAEPIKGAQSSPSSPAPSKTAEAARPTITFPAGTKNVFEGQQTGDPKKDAVLADNAQSINAVYDAIVLGNPKLPALSFYETGNALATDGSFIQGFLSKGNTWIGTIRYFDRQATINSDGSASVVYCSDESKAFLKNRKTGKVDNTPTSAQSYVLYNTRLAKNKQGVWQTTQVVSNRGAKECQP